MWAFVIYQQRIGEAELLYAIGNLPHLPGGMLVRIAGVWLEFAWIVVDDLKARFPGGSYWHRTIPSKRD